MKTEILTNTDETALVETEDVEVVTIIESEKTVGTRESDTPI